MDWNSPTTKKHIKDAEAQGCKLVGAGKSNQYRLYALPCAHEQEVKTGHMRDGNFRCSACLAEKLNQEAEAQGCTLIGAGKSNHYRLYALPCGHEEAVQTGAMRRGGFRCSVCLVEKSNQEAEAQGCTLIGAGRNADYRLYALPCGHEQEVDRGRMRAGSFRCGICMVEKLNQEAKAQGCKLLGAGRNTGNRLYAFPCGHEQVVETKAMRDGGFRCSACLTEKLNQEAEAQGCKLMGAGRNSNYRLYALPCGHELEVAVRAIRTGEFECKTCVSEKLDQEAAAQGCRLLGACEGKDRHLRLYALPCGHEQEIHTGAMRDGGFRCSVCLAEKLNQEAEAQGCTLIGSGGGSRYRLYALPCGHEQEVGTGEIRTGSFRCSTCLAQKVNEEAEAQGCTLIDAGKDSNYRLYALPCGHEQEVHVGSMRDGGFSCSVCLAEKLNQEAEAQGCTLIGAGKNVEYRKYTLPCGHEQELSVARMRDGGFRCSVCLAEKLNQEAEAQGCTLIGAGKDKGYRYRLYSLPCGHEQEVGLGAMRNGSFLCQTSEETSRTLPSNVYLLHIRVDSDEWLKLGYARLVDLRISQYGLPEGAKVTTVYSLPFDTGNEAHAVEADIHSRYKRKRLAQKHMKLFHTISGFDECYPVIMLETLLAEIEAVKQGQER